MNLTSSLILSEEAFQRSPVVQEKIPNLMWAGGVQVAHDRVHSATSHPAHALHVTTRALKCQGHRGRKIVYVYLRPFFDTQRLIDSISIIQNYL